NDPVAGGPAQSPSEGHCSPNVDIQWYMRWRNRRSHPIRFLGSTSVLTPFRSREITHEAGHRWPGQPVFIVQEPWARCLVLLLGMLVDFFVWDMQTVSARPSRRSSSGSQSQYLNAPCAGVRSARHVAL